MLTRSSIVACLLLGGLAPADPPQARDVAEHVSFLASDALGGRDTGTPGFHIATEYVASQFRGIGLEPPVDRTYFQTFEWLLRERDLATVTCRWHGSHRGVSTDLSVSPAELSVEADVDATVIDATLVKLDWDDDLPDLEIDGPIALLLEMPPLRSSMRDPERVDRLRRFLSWAKRHEVAAAFVVDRDAERARPRPNLVRPGAEPRERRSMTSFPVLHVHNAAIIAWHDEWDEGPTGLTIDLDMGAERDTPIELRNVVGLRPGSDPELADEWILVTAHLDHIGTGSGSGDVINNGANDDASGVAGVIEVAAMLVDQPLRRTVLFMTFFGEERGLLGSRAYVDDPLTPLANTVANVNLEHLGRTDDSDEPGPGQVMITGQHYSGVADVMSAAAEAAGLVHNPYETKSKQFFNASDNASFARAGIPAHTLCTSFIFPDYHRPGDHWDRIDYDNMATVVGAVADAVRELANMDEVPTWHEIPDTERYRATRDELE